MRSKHNPAFLFLYFLPTANENVMPRINFLSGNNRDAKIGLLQCDDLRSYMMDVKH